MRNLPRPGIERVSPARAGGCFFSFFLNDTHILFIVTLLDSISQRKSSDDNIDNQDKYHLIDNKQTQVIIYIYSRKRKLGEILLKVNMKCKIYFLLLSTF